MSSYAFISLLGNQQGNLPPNQVGSHRCNQLDVPPVSLPVSRLCSPQTNLLRNPVVSQVINRARNLHVSQLLNRHVSQQSNPPLDLRGSHRGNPHANPHCSQQASLAGNPVYSQLGNHQCIQLGNHQCSPLNDPAPNPHLSPPANQPRNLLDRRLANRIQDPHRSHRDNRVHVHRLHRPTMAHSTKASQLLLCTAPVQLALQWFMCSAIWAMMKSYFSL